MKTINIYLLLGLALISIGCSKGDESSSTVTEYSGEIQKDPNGKALIECTPFIAKMGTLSGSVKAFKYNGIYYPDKVDIKINTSIDLHNRKLSFYRWKQQSNGTVVGDGNRLLFDVTLPGETLPRTGFTVLTATASGAVNTSQLTFTVHGTDVAYHAIQIQISDATTDNVETYSDALIPFVHAHPRDYRAGHPNQNQLLALHPYISQASSNEADTVFARRSYSDFCF